MFTALHLLHKNLIFFYLICSHAAFILKVKGPLQWFSVFKSQERITKGLKKIFSLSRDKIQTSRTPHFPYWHLSTFIASYVLFSFVSKVFCQKTTNLKMWIKTSSQSLYPQRCVQTGHGAPFWWDEDWFSKWKQLWAKKKKSHFYNYLYECSNINSILE